MKNKTGNYKVCMGFLTGSDTGLYKDEGGKYHTSASPSWFSVIEVSSGVCLSLAIYKTRLIGYSKNNDICGDIIFNVMDMTTGLFVEETEIMKANLKSIQKLN